MVNVRWNQARGLLYALDIAAKCGLSVKVDFPASDDARIVYVTMGSSGENLTFSYRVATDVNVSSRVDFAYFIGRDRVLERTILNRIDEIGSEALAT